MYPWHKILWQQFCQQQQQQRLPHALLLSGVSGLGKQEFADRVVANVLCSSLREDHAACGQCHNCQLLNAGNHPDHIVISPEEPGKQIKIDQIRNLKNKQELTSSVASWKTIVISSADSMNVSASNSLLKLLEEPQQNTLLLLISNKPEMLPITVRSRCQNYHFTSPSLEVTSDWLAAQGVALQPKMVMLANGAPLKALKMIKSDIESQFQQLDHDFEAILSGQANPISLAASWKEYELIEVFHYLQFLVKAKLTELMSNKSLNQHDTSQNRYYLKISDCIIGSIKLTSLSNNINKTLLTEEFIVSVMKIKH